MAVLVTYKLEPPAVVRIDGAGGRKEPGWRSPFRVAPRVSQLGPEQKAVEAVRQLMISPGEKDGKPVRVLAQIQVSFRLLE